VRVRKKDSKREKRVRRRKEEKEARRVRERKKNRRGSRVIKVKFLANFFRSRNLRSGSLFISLC